MLHFLQIIFVRREILHFLKLRHWKKLAIELELPAMVTTSQMGSVASLFSDNISAMCADITQAMNCIIIGFSEHQRLIEVIFQQCERIHISFFFHQIAAACKLPWRRKDFFFRKLEYFRTCIEIRWNGCCFRYVCIDVKLHRVNFQIRKGANILNDESSVINSQCLSLPHS